MVRLDPRAAQAVRSEIAAGHESTSLPTLDTLLTEVSAIHLTSTYVPARNAPLAASLGLDRWFTVEVPFGTDIEEWLERFENDPNIEKADPDYIAYPTETPNDSQYAFQWGHHSTGQMLDYCWDCGSHEGGSPVGLPGFDAGAQLAWDSAQGYGSSSVVIAIIDSGVDIDHPDLRLVPGHDYGDHDSNPDDDSANAGHGTACAGIAAAIASNNLGVCGIAGGCSVMPLKVANNAGIMHLSAISNALIHAADNGAAIASMSLGSDIESDPPTDAALSYARESGVTLFAATGNDNASTIAYPAISQYVISVGAASPCGDRKRSSSNPGELNPGVHTDPNGYTCDGERWWGSNYGSGVRDTPSAVDFIAPTILPTTDITGAGGHDAGDYRNWFNGTSCATPYAAGVAALVLSAHPDYIPAQVRTALINGCTDIENVESGSGWDRYSGYGMVNADRAIGMVYVDGSYSGHEDGSEQYPYDTVGEGVGAAQPDDLLTIAAGSYSETPRIDKKLTVRTGGGTVALGR